jgi:hypothetical protein
MEVMMISHTGTAGWQEHRRRSRGLYGECSLQAATVTICAMVPA